MYCYMPGITSSNVVWYGAAPYEWQGQKPPFMPHDNICSCVNNLVKFAIFPDTACNTYQSHVGRLCVMTLKHDNCQKTHNEFWCQHLAMAWQGSLQGVAKARGLQVYFHDNSFKMVFWTSPETMVWTRFDFSMNSEYITGAYGWCFSVNLFLTDINVFSVYRDDPRMDPLRLWEIKGHQRVKARHIQNAINILFGLHGANGTVAKSHERSRDNEARIGDRTHFWPVYSSMTHLFNKAHQASWHRLKGEMVRIKMLGSQNQTKAPDPGIDPGKHAMTNWTNTVSLLGIQR